MAEIAEELTRFLVLVPWLAQHDEGVPVAEVCERLAITRPALSKLIERVALVGTPEGTPDELVDLYVEGERLFVALPQHFTRAPRFSPEEMLALLLTLAPLRSAPVPGLAREAEALTERLLGLGSERAQALAARVSGAVFSAGERDEDASTLALLEQAVRERRVCDVTYYTAGRDVLQERVLRPLALVEQRGAWYVLADDEKRFKVARFKHVALREERFEPPSTTPRDVEQGAINLFEGRAEGEWALRVAVRGATRVFHASAFASVFQWVRAHDEARLLGPPEARRAFLDETRALLARYESSATPRGEVGEE